MTKELRVFGLSEDALGQRLADLLADSMVEVTLSFYEGHGTVTISAEPEVVEAVAEEISLRLSGYIYSDRGETLSACVVGLLTAHGMTVATAESCTGGMIAAALTDVPGASRVIGTGVVSYSNDCKERLLGVSPDTLAADGAVSHTTAGQMARGVRHLSDATVGVSVTGEAGPNPSEQHPVGTVFIGLADKKRTWVEELHLDGPDRASIRRQAADWVLWLLWRYLSAYPAVMAGGESKRVVRQREIPRTQGARHPRLLSRLFPWKGDSRRRMFVKSVAWLALLALLVFAVYSGYLYLFAADRNRELQDSLGDMYWDSTDLTEESGTSAYPKGMLSAFYGLYDLNEDVGGWLYVAGSGVDYPVMQYAGGYYRNHSFMQQYSLYGQLYFGPTKSRQITCIYGQNPGDGQMFSDLLNYRRLSYLQGHGVVECSTLTANETWQIFAVLVVDEAESFAYLPTSEFKSEKAFLAYVDSLRQRSLFTSDLTVSGEDRLLILTTEAEEAYGHAGARIVVVARQTTDGGEEANYRTNHQVVWPKFLMTTARRTASTTVTTATTTTKTTTTTTTDSTTESVTTESVTTSTESATEVEEESTTATQESATTQTAISTEGTTVPTEEAGEEQ